MNPLPHSAVLLSSLPEESRLHLLQENDPLRDWNDVDDRRVCMSCGRKITGRLIQIWRADDGFWFRCPTPGCNGTLRDFGRVGDPLFDDEVWNDWCKTFDPNLLDDSLDQAS